MIVHANLGAVVAEKITHWDLWPTDLQEAYLQVYVEGGADPVVVFIGRPSITKELLLILPTWVDGHLKAGTPEINLTEEIQRLLSLRGAEEKV